MEAFHLDEWIDGTSDGGITPPRTILKIDIEVGGSDKISIDYKYPAESHPYSDVTYHLTEPDKIYTSVYVLTGDRKIYREDCDKLFKNYDSFTRSMVEDKVNAFFADNQVEELEK